MYTYPLKAVLVDLVCHYFGRQRYIQRNILVYIIKCQIIDLVGIAIDKSILTQSPTKRVYLLDTGTCTGTVVPVQLPVLYQYIDICVPKPLPKEYIY
eukprot:SAG11_NODE_6_length_32111_cov_33.703174_15_plen_97_part_00